MVGIIFYLILVNTRDHPTIVKRNYVIFFNFVFILLRVKTNYTILYAINYCIYLANERISFWRFIVLDTFLFLNILVVNKNNIYYIAISV